MPEVELGRRLAKRFERNRLVFNGLNDAGHNFLYIPSNMGLFSVASDIRPTMKVAFHYLHKSGLITGTQDEGLTEKMLQVAFHF